MTINEGENGELKIVLPLIMINAVNRLISPLAVFVHSIGKTKALGPDTAIDDTDHNASAGAICAIKLAP